jgi:hypothetical protein
MTHVNSLQSGTGTGTETGTVEFEDKLRIDNTGHSAGFGAVHRSIHSNTTSCH